MWVLYLFLLFFNLFFVANGQGCQTSYQGMAIDGQDLTHIQGASSTCCQACQKQAGCVAFTWNSTAGGTCWLKTDTQPLYRATRIHPLRNLGFFTLYAANGEFTVMMAPTSANTYSLNTSYVGDTFFDKFIFETTACCCGDVKCIDRNNSEAWGLISIVNNKIYMRVDNYTVLPENATARNSVMIKTQNRFNSGLIILDIDHVPVGPGLWPAFWSYGYNWPIDGEIDILEAIMVNDSFFDHNQISLHTGDGCSYTDASYNYMVGTKANKESCASNSTSNGGCGISAPKGTYNVAFNQAGGGVFAVEWVRDKFLRIWNFVRSNVPADITSQSPNPNPSTWGMPTSYLPIGPNCPPEHFENQAFIFDAGVCGGWVESQFPGGHAGCLDIMRKYPGNFSEAYWAVNYLKIFCRPGDPCLIS